MAENELVTILNAAYEAAAPDLSGQLADYIPELTKVDANDFGLALATIKGQFFTSGNAEKAFTIQSVSKAFTLCMALDLVGRHSVLQKVGGEPTGDDFNTIEFDPKTKRPFNPMVNAGAIAVTGIIYKEQEENAFEYILDKLSKAAGRQLDLNENVYRSESLTGHRNRAIGHLLLGAGIIEKEVENILDLYFRQCSVNVTALDLARMGATFANLGENPITEETVFGIASVRDTLSVMFSCGMYNYSGQWAMDVGIPVKSGVGGGLVGIVNRQLGIGSYSPRLDAQGNSVRGVRAFAALSEELGLHAFDCTNIGSSIIQRFLNR